jgi:hypothetical protein
LTLRDDASHAALVIQNSVTTWQAYNDWGGYSLYTGPGGSFSARSRVVSFDRPYSSQYGNPGNGGLTDFEPMTIAYLEKTFGVTVTEKTDPAIHTDIVVTVGKSTPKLEAPVGP